MIFGTVTITPRAVETHRDSYQLAHLTVISVRRPLLAGSILGAGGMGAFALAFGDLLYAYEIAGMAATAMLSLLAGFRLARIRLLSRDLRGSELSCLIWGSWGRLQRVRREIVAAMENQDARRKGEEA